MRWRFSAPLHAILVHFSIALTGASFGFDVASRLFDRPSLAAAGWWSLAAAGLLSVTTVVSGISSRLGLPMEEGPARSTLRAHMVLGPLFLGLLLAACAWRAMLWERGATVPWTYLAAMSVLLLVMTAQGYLGGELVYRFGADVKGRFRPLPILDGRALPSRGSAGPAKPA
jgi:uncharacterized membrane protein